MQLRAIQVNDGPLRSTLRFADLRDVIAGTFKHKGIEPAPTLHGSDSSRIGPEAVAKLGEMGWMDVEGKVSAPSGYFNEG